MRTELCDRFGIEYPIFVFTPSEKVAAAVTRAGGLGMLGCVRFNDADDLETVLQWMDENTDGKPYGVDIVMPAKVPTEGTSVDINKLIPQSHRDFVDKTLADLGVPPLPEDEERSEGVLGWLHSVARSHVEVALKHPIKLIANALGSPPKDVIDQVHAAGVPVAALAGSAKHALRHVDNGVDIVIAQGHEAGGHTGEIASMVLVPEVVDALGGNAAVLAAGGIGSGRQVAAALALGAQGVWMGSAFLTAAEYDLGVRTEGGASVIQEAHARRDVQRHGAPAHLHRQARAAAQEPLDRRLGRRRRAGAAADAAAEHPRQRGAPAHERVDGSDHGRDAGRPDRRPDERDSARRRHHRRVGQRLRGRHQATRRHPRQLSRGVRGCPIRSRLGQVQRLASNP